MSERAIAQAAAARKRREDKATDERGNALLAAGALYAVLIGIAPLDAAHAVMIEDDGPVIMVRFDHLKSAYAIDLRRLPGTELDDDSSPTRHGANG